MMGLETEYGYVVIAFFVLVVMVFLLRPLSSALYTLSKNWQAVVFFVACLLGGGVFAFQSQNTDRSSSRNMPFFHTQPTEGQIEMAIADCKQFIIAKSENRDFTINPGADSFYRPRTETGMWDTCASVFGQNYWKNDISINGKDGGRLLCDTYKNNESGSREVETWCSTVFAGSE